LTVGPDDLKRSFPTLMIVCCKAYATYRVFYDGKKCHINATFTIYRKSRLFSLQRTSTIPAEVARPWCQDQGLYNI